MQLEEQERRMRAVIKGPKNFATFAKICPKRKSENAPASHIRPWRLSRLGALRRI
jgi:hypothetical protein